jgi:hypothetical protein
MSTHNNLTQDQPSLHKLYPHRPSTTSRSNTGYDLLFHILCATILPSIFTRLGYARSKQGNAYLETYEYLYLIIAVSILDITFTTFLVVSWETVPESACVPGRETACWVMIGANLVLGLILFGFSVGVLKAMGDEKIGCQYRDFVGDEKVPLAEYTDCRDEVMVAKVENDLGVEKGDWDWEAFTDFKDEERRCSEELRIPGSHRGSFSVYENSRIGC